MSRSPKARLESLPVEVLPRYDIDPESLNIEGRLGIDALSQFVVRLDPSRGRMWLRRNPMARNTLLGMDYELFKASGTLLVPVKGGWLVSMVLPASPGLRRGLELGDRITTERSLEEVIDMIRGPGEIIVVRVMDGVETTLRLAP